MVDRTVLAAYGLVPEMALRFGLGKKPEDDQDNNLIVVRRSHLDGAYTRWKSSDMQFVVDV